MKKLMTMIAAVATAFGLFAAVPSITDNAVDFSKFTDVNPWTLTDKDKVADALWTYTDGTPAKDEAQIADGELVLATGAKILTRKFKTNAAVKVDDDLGLFANVKLDFQNQGIDADSIPTATDLTGAKLALFLLDTSDVEGSAVDEGGTNLFAIAGCGATRALYQLSATVDDAFLAKEHSFTIKFYNQALSDSNRAGFMIYMDGENAGAGEGVALKALYRYDLDGDVFDLTERTSCMDGNYLGDLTVNPSLMNWYKQQRLLVSLVQNDNQEFTGVEFKGKASIASVKLTDNKADFPFIPGDAKAIGVVDTALTTKLAASNFSFNPTTGASFANGVITVFDDETSITVTPTFSSDKEVHKITIGEKEGTDSLTFTIEDGTTLTVTEAAAAAYVTVDGGDPKPVASLEDAIDAVNGATTAGTLKLANSVTIDDDLLEDAEMSFNGTDVTLDLNGKIITGCADTRSGTVIFNEGNLTIVDTSDAKTGKIVTVDGCEYAVLNETTATLAIEAGIFDGEVVENGTDTISATAGSFLNTAMTENQVKAFIDEATYKVDGEIVEGYWTVVELPTIEYVNFTVTYDADEVENITVTTNGEAVAEQAGVYMVESNAVVTVAATAKTGYKNVTYARVCSTEIKDGVFTADMDNDEITISAEVIKIGVEVKLGEHVSAVVSNRTQNIEIGTATETTTFNEAAIIGDVIDAYYTADEGYRPLCGSQSEDVIESDIEAGFVAFTKVTALANTYKYSFEKDGAEVGDPIADITYTVETQETLEAPACAWTLEGFEFAGWTNKVAGGEIIAAGATLAKVLANTVLTAAWTEKQGAPDPADDDPTKIDDPSETAAKRYGDRVPEKLANVSAKQLCTWATTVGALTTGEEIKVEAFLFNIANASDAAAVKAEEDHFAFTSITAGVDPVAGKDIPNTNVAGAEYNGTVLVTAFADAACTIPQMPGPQEAVFYKATLNPTPAPAPAE